MKTTYPAEIETIIHEFVESGRYPDSTAVLREALDLLQDAERQREELRAMIKVGIDQLDGGEGQEWTPELRERIRQSARRRFLLGERPSPDVCP